MRILQKKLAEDITLRVHSREDLNAAISASNILFKKGPEAVDDLKQMSDQVFLDVFEGVPKAEIALMDIKNGISIVDTLSVKTNFLKSLGEARRALNENSAGVNKVKVKEDHFINLESLINGKYILLQRGKKNYFVIQVN